jgi:hypothetical protein
MGWLFAVALGMQERRLGAAMAGPDSADARARAGDRRGRGDTGRVEELYGQLLELAKAQNKSKNGGTSIPATFLRVTVQL